MRPTKSPHKESLSFETDATTFFLKNYFHLILIRLKVGKVWRLRCHTLMTNFDRCRPHISNRRLGILMIKIRSGGVEDLSRPHQFSKSPLTNHHRLLHHCNRSITNLFPTDWLYSTEFRTKNGIEISVCDIVNTWYNILFCCDCIWPVLRCTTAL